jgi:ABC-2 type transport system permease protein
MVALLATGFTIQAVLRLREEEAAGRAEELLATALSRRRWAAGHLVVAAAGTALLLALAGAGMGLAYAIGGADAGEVPRLAGATLPYAPAAWLLGALALAAYGVAPRAAALAWAPLAGSLVVGLLGPLLGLPSGIEDLSPYRHVPRLPGHALSILPLLTLTAIAAALTALGLAALQRRDVA